jgi:hypothetical protein
MIRLFLREPPVSPFRLRRRLGLHHPEAEATAKAKGTAPFCRAGAEF